jgi:hypothetical protein
VGDDAAWAEGVDGSVVHYRERLYAPPVVWLVVTVLVGSLAVAYGFYLGRTPGVVTFVVAEALAVWWLASTAEPVVVDDRVLRAGRARLPLCHVGRIAPLDREQTRDAQGRLADPTAFLCTRGWILRSVLVEVDDPDDPHPYWLVSTRDGHALARALAPARDAARAAAGVPTARDSPAAPAGARTPTDDAEPQDHA